MTIGRLDEDKRDSNRAFFTLDDSVSANLAVNGIENKSIPVTVLSISSGGIGFLGTRYKLPKIDPGDRLTLTDIQAPLPLGTIDRAEVAVKYIVDYNKRIRLSYGCEFIEIPNPQCNRIREFVRNRLHRMGFY
jgi:PilZ domain